jgi:hypothetical protein
MSEAMNEIIDQNFTEQDNNKEWRNA